MDFLNRTPESQEPSEREMMTVTCPVCSRVIAVECAPGGLHAPSVRCKCGTIINNELGYFSPPA